MIVVCNPLGGQFRQSVDEGVHRSSDLAGETVDLRGERSRPCSDLATVRHDYDADHRASLNYRSRFDNADRK